MSAQGEHNCVLCEMKLDTKEALQEHFRKHANKEINMRGQPVKCKNEDTRCDICNRTFETIPATLRHRFKAHSNLSTKFYCSYCGKQFPLKNHRDNHLFSHNLTEGEGKDEYKKCKECNVIFYNQKALDYHYRSIHKRMIYLFQPIATPPPSNKIKLNSMNDALSVYYCHLCGVEYIIKFNLQQHLEKMHTQKERDNMPEDLIKCTVCSALFYNKKAYNIHNSYHQPDDLYVTSEQQRMQTVTKVDQDFDIRRVESIAEKYIPRSNVFKRTIKERPEPNKVQKIQIKTENETEHETENEIESHLGIKTEIKRERCMSLDESVDINEFSDSESDVPLKQRIAS